MTPKGKAGPTPAGQSGLFKQRLQSARQKLHQHSQTIPRRVESGQAPLSFAQRNLWLAHQMDPASPAYNRPTALRILGPLDLSILEKALGKIVRRHDILRTTFRLVNEEPVQQVHPPVPSPLVVVDLSGLAEDEKLRTASVAVKESARQPFDLEQGPVYRWQVYRLSELDHLLLFVTPHIVFDGWSEEIFRRELGTLCEAFLNKQAPGLPDIAIQYADYAVWQRKEAQEGDLEPGLRYWMERLAGPLPVLELAISHPRPSRQSWRGAAHAFVIPASLVSKLNAFGQEGNGTLFMVALAAFAVLIYRYSGQEDILIGAPLAGRNREELEPLIGCFLNNLVLRCDLSGEPTFTKIFQRVRQVCLEAYQHKDTPFDKLVETLQPERDASRTPVFQVMFNLKNFPVSPAPEGNLAIEPFPMDTGISHYDLSIELVEGDHEIRCNLHYSTDLYDQKAIDRMSKHYLTLLEQAVLHSECPISQFSILTEAERQQMLVDWNNTRVEYPTDLCVHEAFSLQARQSPTAPAIVSGNTTLTFAELNRKVNQLAHTLRARGVGPDHLVGLMVDRSPDMVIGILGILKAGGAYLPLDPNYPADRLAFMLEDAGIEVLLTQKRLSGSQPPGAGVENSATTQQAWAQGSFGVRHLIFLDTDWETIARQPDHDPGRNAEPENLAYVIYTSGSTGKPKGVMINHRSVLNLLTGLRRAIYVHLPSRRLRVGLNAPLSFDAFVQQFLALVMGHTLYIIPQEVRLDGEALLNFLRAHRLEVLGCVPTQLKMLLSAGLLDENAWQPLAMMPGGEAIDESTWRFLAGTKQIEFFNMYGPTECTVDSLIGRVKDSPDKPVIGKAVANTLLYVLDTHQQPTPVGIPGELYIGGPGLARGYLNRPELTAERFVPYPPSLAFLQQGNRTGEERLYRTGDLVRWLPDGNMEFLGRIDRQVKLRGFRIELGEIEAALLQHPRVDQAVVQDWEDPSGDKRLAAYLVSSAGEPPTREELREGLKQKLPEYMIPSAFVFMESLPQTPSGKIDRRALPLPEAVSFQPESGSQAPRTPLEEVIGGIWVATLGLESIGIEDNFFSLGGHSLLATRLIARIRETFQIELPVSILFENPTVAGLALAMVQASDDPAALHQTAELFLSLEQLSEAELEEMLTNQQDSQGGQAGEVEW